MKITIDFPRKAIANALCSAFEGGIKYWCYEVRFPSGSEAALAAAREDWIHPDGRSRYYGPRVGSVIYVLERDTGVWFPLWRARIRDGLKVMAETQPGHFGDLLSDQGDATTADVFVQLCLFGEVRYG